MSAELHRAVQNTLAGKHLGTPVFVRYLLSTQDKPAAVLPHLARIAGTIRNWLAQAVERVYAVGLVKTGQVTVTLEFRGGGSALIGWWSGRQSVDLFVLGNRGAIYHEADPRESSRLPDDKPDAALQTLIERALHSGRPEAAAK